MCSGIRDPVSGSAAKAAVGSGGLPSTHGPGPPRAAPVPTDTRRKRDAALHGSRAGPRRCRREHVPCAQPVVSPPARGRQGSGGAGVELPDEAQGDPSPFWRVCISQLLHSDARAPSVQTELLEGTVLVLLPGSLSA